MEIQSLSHTDIPSLTDLLPPGWETIIPTLLLYTRSDDSFPIKVTIDHKIVGIGSTTIHSGTAWLAHIIVHPEYRNQSIGKLITQALIDISHAHSCDTIYLLATDLGEPVYKKAGFETEIEYLYFKGIPTPATSLQSEHILPFHNDFRQQLSAIDHQVSGEDRMILLAPYLSDAFVYVTDNALQGFYLPTLGDGLIAATTPSAGQALMSLRLTTKDFAAFPADNVIATATMHQYHFTQLRREKRMRLGKAREWQPANLYNRIGGHLG